MSDTIDAAAQTAIRLSRTHNPAVPAAPAAEVTARDLVRLAQGFYFIFWGLLVAVLTSSQLLMSIGVHVFTESFLGAAVVAVLVGSWRLFQVRSLGEIWRRRARVVLALAVLLDYFCIFFGLWRRLPENTYLLGNALAFAATAILYLIASNHAMAALATAFGRPDMDVESRLLGGSNIALLLLPYISLVIYLVFATAIRHGNAFIELQSLLDRINPLVILVLLLPFSLTLSLAWGCKDAVLRQLVTFHPNAASESEPK